MKKISAAALSWLVVGTWWYTSPADADRKTDNALANGTKEQETLPDPFEIEDSDAIAAVPMGFSSVSIPTRQPSPTPASKSAKRLKIQVDVTNPNDLKVKEGQRVAHNQLIADYRQPERIALKAELDRVNLSIEKLKSAPKVTPIPPVKVKEAKGSILPNYAQEEAEIAAAKTKLVDIQRKYQLAQKLSTTPLPETAKIRSLTLAATEIETTIAKQQHKIDTLGTMDDIDQPIQEHEATKLAKLKQSLPEAKTKIQEATATEQTLLAARLSKIEEIKLEFANAQRDLQVAQAKLTAAVEKHQQAQLDRQIAAIDRQERVFKTELERVKQTEVINLQNHDREYQLAQLQLKKTQLEQQIRGLTGVVAPFDGTVKRVKLLAQQGNVLRYEVGLMYAQATVQPRSDVPVWREDK
jgi:hypothetical protein